MITLNIRMTNGCCFDIIAHDSVPILCNLLENSKDVREFVVGNSLPQEMFGVGGFVKWKEVNHGKEKN